MLKIVIIGYGPLAMALTRAVQAIAAQVELLGVFPWSYHSKFKQKAVDNDDKQLIKYLDQQRIPILKFKSINHYQFVSYLKTEQPHIVLVGSWGEIIKPFVLNQNSTRFINCHPSLLPLHRGPNPYSQVILQGDAQTGVTFHLIDAGIDTGPILKQAGIPITQQDTAASIRFHCAKLAQSILPQLLLELVHQTIVAKPQVFDPAVTPYEPIDEMLGWIRWEDDPMRIDRRLRATAPWWKHIVQFKGIPMAFSKGKIVPRPSFLPNSALPPLPGTLLHIDKTGYWVATIDPERLVHLSNRHYFTLWDWLTNWWFTAKLRPGQRFQIISA